MFDDFSFFDYGGGVDYGSFDVDFNTFDMGDAFPAFDETFDLGGVNPYGDSDFEGSADLFDSDGSYVSYGENFEYSMTLDVESPTDGGIVWANSAAEDLTNAGAQYDAEYVEGAGNIGINTGPFSADGLNLPNVKAGQLIDVAKAGVPAVGAVMSGTKANTVKGTGATPAGGSTNANAIQSIIGNLGSVIKSGFNIAANIEDTNARVQGKVPQQNTARGAASGITGGTMGKVNTTSGREPGVSPVVLIVAALGGAFLLFKAA